MPPVVTRHLLLDHGLVEIHLEQGKVSINQQQSNEHINAEILQLTLVSFKTFWKKDIRMSCR